MIGMAKMRWGAYVRVSTYSQNELGQVAEIKKWCKQNGVNDIHWFIDKDPKHYTGGDRLDRPQFMELQYAINAGNIQGVVVFKLDRLSRKFYDGIRIVGGWADRNIRIVSVTQPIDIYGPLGNAIMGLLFAFAEMEQDYRRERQAAGIAIAKQAGMYTGRVLGSKNHVEGVERHGLTQGELAERCRELYDEGLSFQEIAEQALTTVNAAKVFLRGTVWRRHT